jgi:hypothetical protein
VDAVDRADVQAGLVFDVDARLGDDVGHGWPTLAVSHPVTLPRFWVASTKPEAALVRSQG